MGRLHFLWDFAVGWSRPGGSEGREGRVDRVNNLRRDLSRDLAIEIVNKVDSARNTTPKTQNTTEQGTRRYRPRAENLGNIDLLLACPIALGGS